MVQDTKTFFSETFDFIILEILHDSSYLMWLFILAS